MLVVAKDRAEFLRLQWHIAALRFEIKLIKHLLLLRKAGFKPDQPRDDQGRWVDTGAGSRPSVSKPLRITIYPRLHETRGDPAGLPPPPDIPAEEPDVSELRNLVLKETAKWLVNAALRESVAGPIVGTFLNVLDAAVWIRRFYPYIQSYLDPPDTLEELQRSASSYRRGYQIHHIVEQTAARREGFSRALIDGRDNLVSIPTFRHWEVTGWYTTPNTEFGGLSPRAYLKGKDWSERYRVGLLALKRIGILKP